MWYSETTVVAAELQYWSIILWLASFIKIKNALRHRHKAFNPQHKKHIYADLRKIKQDVEQMMS